MINKENIQKIVHALEAEELSFNMNTWNDEIGRGTYRGDKPQCGTVACIGGHGAHIMHKEGNTGEKSVHGLSSYAVGDWLGLTERQREHLFFEYPQRTTRKQAIEVLENLIATGVVDWTIIKNKKRKQKVIEENAGE